MFSKVQLMFGVMVTTLCCNGLVAAASSASALEQLRDEFVSHRSLQVEAAVTMRMDAESGGHNVQSQLALVCDGDRFAVRQWALAPDGQWVPFVSTGWDGDTAWRVDQAGAMLTHWASPQPNQPGSLANPLYLAASFLAGDLARPGGVVTAADVSSGPAWEAAMERASVGHDGHIIIPFAEEAAAGLALAAADGNPGAARMEGGWFELVPAEHEGFPLTMLMLKSSQGESLVVIRFTGEMIASEDGRDRAWPSRVVCSMMEAGEPVMEVEYVLERIAHAPGGQSQCSPGFAGVHIIVDGDAPLPPA